MKGILCVAFSAAIVGCTSAKRTREPAPTVDDAVWLIVGRVIQTHGVFRSALDIPICIEDQSAHVDADALVRRISQTDRRVRSCKSAGDSQHAVYVKVRSIEGDMEGHIIIHAGYYCGPLCADDSTYTVGIFGASWRILAEEPHWVS